MAKWADYYISAVHYDNEHSHIETVRVHSDIGGLIGGFAVWSREAVVSNIQVGYSFITIRKGPDNTWLRGEDVRIVRINGIDYLRTDNNSTTSDNLGKLPEF